MHTQCVANSGKHQRQPLNLVEHVCVCAFNCLIQNCPIAIAIHISQIMTRERYEFIYFLHYSLTDTQTHTHARTQTHSRSIAHKANVNFITIHITYFIIVCGTYGKSVCIRIWNKRCVCAFVCVQMVAIKLHLEMFIPIWNGIIMFVRQLLKMLCGHNTI